MGELRNRVLAGFLPDRSLACEAVEQRGDEVTLRLATTGATAPCPVCGAPSARVHSRYERTLGDLAWGGRPVRLRVRARRFVCRAAACPRRVFAERLGQVAPVHARRCGRRVEVEHAVGVALGGAAGARRLARLRMPASGATLLRRVRRAAPPPVDPPRVVGVDDWALRRGVRFGTIVVDLERRRPLDLLPERTAEVLADWLSRHPSIGLVARDRSTESARGIALGAPAAAQVVDRWHLLRNLREAVERAVARHPTCLMVPGAPAAPAIPLPARGTPGRRERRLARYEAVRGLLAAGLGLRAVGRRLGLARGTVKAYARAAAFPERPERRRAPGILDPHEPYLTERWAAGCRNGRQLWREVRERGYPGGPKMVARWAQRHRTSPSPHTPKQYVRAAVSRPAPPRRRAASPRHVARLVVGRPDGLTAEVRMLLEQVVARNTDVAAAVVLARRFAAIVRDRVPGDLDAWLDDAEAGGVPDMRTLARGMRQDAPAIRAALTLPWSTGPVEGHVNRLKLLKRQMYGRAKLDLLRLRLLAG
jgi:transposase